MIDNFKSMLDSEYNNSGELFGIDAALNGELSAYWGAMNPVEKAKFIQKVGAKPHPSKASRAEMEKHFKELPDHVKASLLKGDLRLADYTLYSIKRVSSKTIKMFEPQDDKEVGVRNIANAKLPKNMVFLVSGVVLLAGVPDNADRESIKHVDFKSISNFPALANGEYTLKANKKQIIPENQVTRWFITDNDHTVPLGFFKLDNPRLIRDEELIEFVIDLGTMQGLDPNTVIYVGLIGTGTTP